MLSFESDKEGYFMSYDNDVWYRRGHHQEAATSMREQVLETSPHQANLQCILVIKILNTLSLLVVFALIGCPFCCLL